MNKTIYHLRALVMIYRMVVFAMICDHSGKNKSPFLPFIADHVLKRPCSRDQCVCHFENFFRFLINIMNVSKVTKFQLCIFGIDNTASNNLLCAPPPSGSNRVNHYLRTMQLIDSVKAKLYISVDNVALQILSLCKNLISI